MAKMSCVLFNNKVIVVQALIGPQNIYIVAGRYTMGLIGKTMGLIKRYDGATKKILMGLIDLYFSYMSMGIILQVSLYFLADKKY